MMWINWKNITYSQHSARKKSFGGTFSFSNCHIIGLDNGSLVLIVFGSDPPIYTYMYICIYWWVDTLLGFGSVIATRRMLRYAPRFHGKKFQKNSPKKISKKKSFKKNQKSNPKIKKLICLNS
jgi:hypothetical protein